MELTMRLTRASTGLAITTLASLIVLGAPEVRARQQQPGAPGQDILVYAHLFAANPADPSSTQVLGTPTLRVAPGRTATADFNDSTAKNAPGFGMRPAVLARIRMEVTPSDLGAGKVALKVIVQVRRTGGVATSTFDVLAGAGTAAATIALEDATGAFITDEKGRTLFVTFQTSLASGSAVEAVKPGNGVTWPQIVSEFKPKYTDEARRRNLQGTVELEIVVREDGSVGDVRVTKSPDRTYGLDDAAVAAARQWRFKPGLRNGVPVATTVGLVLEFRPN
jgi:TonB family protein